MRFCERRGKGRGGANYLKKSRHVTSAFINCVKRKAKKIRGFLIIVPNFLYTLRLKRLQDIFFFNRSHFLSRNKLLYSPVLKLLNVTNNRK